MKKEVNDRMKSFDEFRDILYQHTQNDTALSIDANKEKRVLKNIAGVFTEQQYLELLSLSGAMAVDMLEKYHEWITNHFTLLPKD